jgi:hypothetical protein
MNVEIGAEAAQFPEKEYINGIAVAVHIGYATLQVNSTGHVLWVSHHKIAYVGGYVTFA